MTQLPWSDLKVAFPIEDPDPVWDSGILWPEGWDLIETDCSGARCVAVFRVDGVPIVEHGEAIARALRSLEV